MNNSKKTRSVLNSWFSDAQLLIFIIVIVVGAISGGTAIKMKLDSTVVKADSNMVKISGLQQDSIEHKVLLREIKENQKDMDQKLDRLIERLIQ